MNTKIILAVLSITLLTFLSLNTQSYESGSFLNSSNKKVNSQNMLGTWTGFLALQIPSKNQFCMYQIDYKTIKQDNGEYVMTGNSVKTYSQFLRDSTCRKYNSDIKGLLNKNTDFTRLYFEQDAKDLSNWNYYGQTTGGYIIGYNLDVETFVDHDYRVDYDVYHSLVMYNEDNENVTPQDQLFEIMVQDFQLFAEIKDNKDTSCSQLQGLWEGNYLIQNDRNYHSNCLYQANVQIDGTDQILRIIGEGTEGIYATSQKEISECQPINIDFIGICSERDQSVLLNGETAQAVYNQDQVILQSKYQMLVLTRQ